MPRRLIDAHNVSVRLSRGDHNPVVALDGVTLSVTSGERVVVIGSSGAGKTTLLRSLTGFVTPDSGQLTVDGVDLTDCHPGDLRRLRQRVATIYQHFNLVERLSALDNVLHGRLSHVGLIRGMLGVYPRRDRVIAFQALRELGLGDHALQRVDQLSGGERQRVTIARALVQEPVIVLADEPAASLDLALTRQIMSLLTDLNKQHGLTVLVNLHDLELARSSATRIIGLRRGAIVYDGPPTSLTDEHVRAIYDVASEPAGAIHAVA